MKNIKKIIIGIVLSLVVIANLIAVTERMSQAQVAGRDEDIIKKLDEISDNQKVIMGTLISIREELKIVKIRVTQQQ